MKIKIGSLKEKINISREEEEILDSLLNYQPDTEIELEELIEEVENLDEFEIADSLVNPHTASLLEWYQDDLNRVYYMNEAITELGARNGFDVLSGGQFIYYNIKVYEIKDKILEHLKMLKEGE